MKINEINYEELWNNSDPKIYEIVITADTNDADYITSTETVSEEEITVIKLFAEMIKGCKNNYNWATGEYCDDEDHPLSVYPEMSEEAYEWFNDFLPYGEHGIHTIKSIVYYPIPTAKITLL